MSFLEDMASFLEGLGDCEGDECLYGRICTTVDGSPPEFFADTPNRSTVFLFGTTTIRKVVEKSPYHLLIHLGLLPKYIHLKACIQQAGYWLVLMKYHDGLEVTPHRGYKSTATSSIVPATWDGVLSFVSRYYPLAKDDLKRYWADILARPVRYFERKAGFKFMTALEDVTGRLFMSYDRYCELDRPVTSWQVRLFLYCELRILELFSGDGFTYRSDGRKGDEEFLAPNFRLSELKRENVLVIPLDVVIPDKVHASDERCELKIKGDKQNGRAEHRK